MDARLLIVEDNVDLLDLSLMMLETLGYNGIGVTSAEEGLSLLEVEKYALLLTDLSLPGKLSGADLIKIVRERYPDLPIVVVSGYDRPKALDQYHNVSFMTKPYLIVDFAKTIEDALNPNLHSCEINT